MSPYRGIGTPQERRKFNKSKQPLSSDDSRAKALDLRRLGFRPRAEENLVSMLASVFLWQPHLSVSVRLTSNSFNRIKVVGPRNREENSVLPERSGFRMNKFAALQSLGANVPTLFQRSKERRKLPLAIARAKGAISASYQVALLVLPRQWRVTPYLDTKYEGWRLGLQRLFGPVAKVPEFLP